MIYVTWYYTIDITVPWKSTLDYTCNKYSPFGKEGAKPAKLELNRIIEIKSNVFD